MRRTRLAAPFALAALALSARPAAGQDVVESARVRGVSPPTWVLETLRDDPGAFEFQRAWRHKVRLIRERRAAVEAGAPGPLLTSARLVAQRATLTGTLRVPVVAARPTDGTSPFAASTYQDKLFGTGGGSYTVESFYEEMSRGAFSVTGAVTGWIPLPRASSFYYGDPADAFVDSTGTFLKDALDLVDAAVDFSQYDNDGPDGVPNSGDDDGYADVVAFLYPAASKSCGGAGIWPHRWVYRGWYSEAYTTGDVSASGGFVRVDDYVVQSGVECDGSSIMEIGTLSHELGHAIALPDLYDTDSSNGASEGIGHWGLMGSGNWNRPGSPAHMSAWSKDFLGWVAVQELTGTATGVALAPVYDAGTVLRYRIPGTDEHFLLEHRAPSGADQHIAGPGLLVWHVDQSVIDDRTFDNRVNADENAKGVDLEEADGLRHLDDGVNRGDAGDPFPGSSGRTAFGHATTPSSATNAGGSSSFELTQIALSGSTLTFDVTLSGTYGDPSRDGAVAAFDALICLSDVVGKDTSAFDVALCDVAPDDGTSFNGSRTALDALAILSHAVGKALPVTYRVGVPR